MLKIVSIELHHEERGIWPLCRVKCPYCYNWTEYSSFSNFTKELPGWLWGWGQCVDIWLLRWSKPTVADSSHMICLEIYKYIKHPQKSSSIYIENILSTKDCYGGANQQWQIPVAMEPWFVEVFCQKKPPKKVRYFQHQRLLWRSLSTVEHFYVLM